MIPATFWIVRVGGLVWHRGRGRLVAPGPAVNFDEVWFIDRASVEPLLNKLWLDGTTDARVIEYHIRRAEFTEEAPLYA